MRGNLISKGSYNPTAKISSLGMSHSNSASERDPQSYSSGPRIDPLANRSAWKTQRECSVCGDALGSGGDQQNKKHYCRFCYQAVCAKCSPLTARHPETGRDGEKICMRCYNSHLKEKFTQESPEKASSTGLTIEVSSDMSSPSPPRNRKITHIEPRNSNLTPSGQVTRPSIERKSLTNRSSLVETSRSGKAPVLVKNANSSEEKPASFTRDDKARTSKMLERLKQLQAENAGLKKQLNEFGKKELYAAPPRANTEFCSGCSVF